MFAQFVRGFTTLRWATPIAASLRAQHSRIFQRIGYAPFAELRKRISIR